ncbi:hypothetical protein XELAEV_18012832mg [Xenopus laevis]|uniref:Uncharacterized protein n=1 Tax=Xenopus laevis TaxID=8355 RepID=A0A974HYT0_XENLA|nr:hypothetical protein XELAEV_18012832mg [Xenopus laevis]
MNKDLCDHHTFPEEAVKRDCETRWILEQFYSSITGETFLDPENSGLLFCFGYYVLYDLVILVSRKSFVLW